MALNYFEFDYSEGASDAMSWDAMACIVPARLPEALREAEEVLQWAHAAFGPPDDSGTDLAQWDFDLQLSQDDTRDLHAQFDAATGAITTAPVQREGGRCTVTLTLSGSASFGQALAEQFEFS